MANVFKTNAKSVDKQQAAKATKPFLKKAYILFRVISAFNTTQDGIAR